MNIASVLDMLGGSRSTTPVSLISRKSPTADMGVQVNQPSNKDSARRNSQNRGSQQQQQQQNQQPQHQQRDRKMDGGPLYGNDNRVININQMS